MSKERQYSYFLKSISSLEKEYSPLSRKELLFSKFYYNLKDQLPPNYLKESDKEDMFEMYNKILTQYSQSERVIKYFFSESFLATTDFNVAFEVKCFDSRIDFLAFNQEVTIGFEIKSKNDSLMRLQKQLDSYAKVFNYNYVVIDSKHLNYVLEKVDEYIGIVTFENYNGQKKIHSHKPPKFYQPKACDLLQLFNQNELRKFFKDTSIEHILSINGDSMIRCKFLELLSYRYKEKSSFLRDNMEEIYNLDYQYFFKNNIEPELIYN